MPILQVGKLRPSAPLHTDVMKLLYLMPNAPLTHPQMTYSTCHSLRGGRSGIMTSDLTVFARCSGPRQGGWAGGARDLARGHPGRKRGQAGRQLFSGLLGRGSGLPLAPQGPVAQRQNLIPCCSPTQPEHHPGTPGWLGPAKPRLLKQPLVGCRAYKVLSILTTSQSGGDRSHFTDGNTEAPRDGKIC